MTRAAPLLLATLLLCSTAQAGAPGADESRYLTMRDGTRVAISLWFPPGGKEGRKLPVMLTFTRYGRAATVNATRTNSWLKEGFVVAAVDVRGTTSSFGERRVDLGPDEVADGPEVVAWLAAQPWSSGQLMTTGFSYLANTADMAMSQTAPALKGAIVRHADFDIAHHLMMPGGVTNQWMADAFAGFTLAMDTGKSSEGPALDCLARVEDCAALYPILSPVDDDRDFTLLRQALAGRRRWTAEDFARIQFRDDRASGGISFAEMSASRWISGLRAEARPVQYWGSWVDAGTAESGLARWRSTRAPMEVWITANDHGEQTRTDPFFPVDASLIPSADEQRRIMAGFAGKVLRGEPVERRIHYAVLGTTTFKTTSTWPPRGVKLRRWSLSAEGRLDEKAGAPATVVRDMPLDATSGARTRWTANLGFPAAYGDRRERKAALPSFTTAAFGQDLELAGHPVVRLRLASRSSDPAVFAYLEDVAPDGRVTYVTEGRLRVINRKPAARGALPFDPGPAGHSLARADALPVTPGRFETVELALFPVAAKVKKGHALRLTLSASDTSVFRTYSNGGPERFELKVGRGGGFIDLPLRPWRD